MIRIPWAPRLAALALTVAWPTLGAETVTRGPYLQMGTATAMTVRWRTDLPGSSRVTYGTALGKLDGTAGSDTATTEHIVRLTGLAPDQAYVYTVGNATTALAGSGDASYGFVTAPPVGAAKRTRLWAIGDFGTGGPSQARVRNAYTTAAGTTYTDAILMLGDNAYNSGQDAEYQSNLFAVYPALLRRSVAWPTIGNHDTAQSPHPPETIAYLQSFTLPARGEAGGLASGTARYYSFDRANLHCVCLDSMTSSRARDGAMATWLAADLASTAQDWIIAFWHHPAYTKGTHDSDTEIEEIEMRVNLVPILEAGGVDLALSGHSHVYERSFLIDGHYGDADTFTAAMKLDGGDGRADGTGAYAKGPGAHHGAVYETVGCSGASGTGTLDHPAMLVSLGRVFGSMVIDIEGPRLDAAFLDDQGATRDHFTIIKRVATRKAGGAGGAP